MRSFLILVMVMALSSTLNAKTTHSEAIEQLVEQSYPRFENLYQHFHANPELSFEEKNTAATLAAELNKRGFTVSTDIGGHGIVAIMKNGDGPVLLIRSDLDALPLTEKTGLPYASKVRVKNKDGTEVGVMHACGHDLHMTNLVGTADIMVKLKDKWQGTLILIGQPAEEFGAGAREMLKEGLFKKFQQPDYAIALHVAGDMQAGKIGYSKGYAMANVDSVDITIFGKGGHGAMPHKTIDPIVIAAQTILALQTIVSRELDPNESAVVTIGYMKAGTKRNIIPDSALLQLTVRSYSDEVRNNIMAAIKRISHGIAKAAGVDDDQLPKIKIKQEYTPSLYNNPQLTERLVKVWQQSLGVNALQVRSPEMIGEDFARYGRTQAKIPICMFRVGTARQSDDGIISQSLHSADFSPDFKVAIKNSILATTEAALELLKK